MHKNKLMTKAIAIFMCIVIVFSFNSCNTFLSKMKFEKSYEVNQDLESLTNLLVIAFDSSNMEDMKKYGEKYFFEYANNNEKQKVLRNCLIDMFGEEANDDDFLFFTHDNMLIYYLISTIYVTNSNEKISFSSQSVGELKKVLPLFLQDYSELFSSAIPYAYASNILSKEEQNIFADYISYVLPYMEENILLEMLTFLKEIQLYIGEKDESKYVQISTYITNQQRYDSNMGQQIYSFVDKDMQKISKVTKDEVVNHIKKLNMPTNVIDSCDFFGVHPYFNNENGVLWYEIDGYRVVFYGIPTSVVEVVDNKTGETVFEKLMFE